MKILFFVWFENVLLAAKMARYLEEQRKDLNIEKFTFFMFRHWEEDLLKDLNLKTPYDVVNIYREFSYDSLPKASFEELREYEDKYGLPNLWFYIVLDREYYRNKANDLYKNRYVNVPDDKVYDLLIWNMKQCEELIQREKFDLVINIDFAAYEAMIFNTVAIKNGCKHYYLMDSRFPERIKVIQDDRVNPKLIRNFHELEGKKESAEDAKIIDSILDTYRRKAYTPILHSVKKQGFLARLQIKNLFKFFTIMKKNRPKIDLSYWKVIAYGIRYRYRIIMLKFMRDRYFEDIDENDRIVYYPLHEQPELAIDYANPFLQDQVELVFNIAKALPAGYVLYVKDHPGSIGTKPLSYYKRLKNLPNVKVLFHREDGYKLINQCDVVTTITGTAGWEGMMLKKPVITFADVYFNLADNCVYYVNDFMKLPEALRKCINDFHYDEEQIRRLINAKYKATYPGKLWPLYSFEEVSSDENIKLLMDAVFSEYAADMQEEGK